MIKMRHQATKGSSLKLRLCGSIKICNFRHWFTCPQKCRAPRRVNWHGYPNNVRLALWHYASADSAIFARVKILMSSTAG